MNRPLSTSLEESRSQRLVRRLIAGFVQNAQAHQLVLRPGVVELLVEAVLASRLRRHPGTGNPDLAAVHAWEQAELLRLAIELQLHESLSGRFLSAPPDGVLTEEAWRSRCAEEIGCALANQVRVDGLLLTCMVQDREHWACVESLGEHLLTRSDRDLDQWLMVRILISVGKAPRARRIASRMNPDQLPNGLRASLAECLALDDERSGRARQALGGFERAAALGGGMRNDLAAALVALELKNDASLRDSLERFAHRRGGASARARAVLELREKRVFMERPIAPAFLFELERACAESSLPVIAHEGTLR